MFLVFQKNDQSKSINRLFVRSFKTCQILKSFESLSLRSLACARILRRHQRHNSLPFLTIQKYLRTLFFKFPLEIYLETQHCCQSFCFPSTFPQISLAIAILKVFCFECKGDLLLFPFFFFCFLLFLPFKVMSVKKLMHHHSFDTVTMSNGRRPSRANDTTFSCSQQSILSAMDRFVKSVNNMDSTVLVPIKLRDMDIGQCGDGNYKTSRCQPPTILQNGDLYAFYVMLHDVKKELLWGPSTALSTIATFVPTSTLNGSSTIMNHFSGLPTGSNPSVTIVNSSHHCRSASTTSTPMLTGTTSAATVRPATSNGSLRQLTGSSVSLMSMDTPSAPALVTSRKQPKHQNTHSRQPSDDSLGSLDSAASTFDLDKSNDMDSESEVDSLLQDRESAAGKSGNSGNGGQQDDHTLHLAASFKYHLQGLHTILHQLADTADFFCQRYQEEVDSLGVGEWKRTEV